VAAVTMCLFAQLIRCVLGRDIRRLKAANPLPLLAVLAVVTTAGAWATHFIALLAYRPGLPSGYSPWLTALSFLVCVTLVFFAYTIRSPVRRALTMTVAIGTMHFIGMAALEIAGRFEYDLGLVAVSLGLGAGLIHAASRWFGRSRRRVPLGSAVLLTLAIATIHFGSMAAATIVPDPAAVVPADAISPHSLAAAVVTVIVAVLGVCFAALRAESRLAAHALAEADRMKVFADKAMEGLAILQGDTIVDANDVFWQMSGLPPDLRPERLTVGEIIPGLSSVAAADRGEGFFEAAMVRRGHGELAVEASLRDTSLSGRACRLLVVRDISDRKAAAARIAHLAAHDPLTGVGNRPTFNRALAERLAEADARRPLGLLCIDLDRFKPVNDLYGHDVGDRVLIAVTKRIGGLLRGNELLARLGGDEFAVLTARPPALVSQLAEAIVEALARPFTVEDHPVSIGCSIGIAYAPADAADAQTLHSKADLALYRAQSDGGGRFCFFDRGMDDHVIATFRLRADLRNALREGQLSLHYQPLASLESGAIIGFEALLRWRHPELGDISPATFVPLAEETGLIIPIGEWVLREACREAGRWRNALKIAVNLSPVQFTAGNILEVVASALASAGLDPSRLDLEITEGVLLKDADRALRVLNSLKAMGVRISMDDFGTGYSSLSYFRQFPFDKVKIDQAFIRDMETNAQSQAIVTAIIGLAKGLDVAILAEGVETATQMDMLKRKGCEQIQGFAVSRPAPIEAFSDLIDAPRDAGKRGLLAA
jgi:diguanylate cyclase (GGDEF)-like protein